MDSSLTRLYLALCCSTAGVSPCTPTSYVGSDMSTLFSQKDIVSTFGTTSRSKQLVPTNFATESRTCTHTAAPSHFLTSTHASIEYRQEFDIGNTERNIVVDEFLSRGKRAGEIPCTTCTSKLVRQACPAKRLMLHTSPWSLQLTTKRNTSGASKQQTPSANCTGYEHNSGQHTGVSVKQSSHSQNLAPAEHT